MSGVGRGQWGSATEDGYINYALSCLDGDDVHMVGHEAIGPDLHPGALSTLGQQIEVERIVTIFEKRLLTPVPALGDVVRDARQDHAGKARHGGRIAERSTSVNLGVFVPVTVIPLSR